MFSEHIVLVMGKARKKSSGRASSRKTSPSSTLSSLIVEILRSTTSNLSTGDILERSKSFKLSRPYTKHEFKEGVDALIERRIVGKSRVSNENEYYLRNRDEAELNNLPKKVVQNRKLLKPETIIYGSVKDVIIDVLRGQHKRLTSGKIIEMTRLYDLSKFASNRRGIRKAIYSLNYSGILDKVLDKFPQQIPTSYVCMHASSCIAVASLLIPRSRLAVGSV